MTKTQKGAIIGTTGGAAVGAVIGRASGNTALGTIIGAAVGGTAGVLIGKKMDKQAEEIKKTCQRCFQALRIEVNNEFGVLEKFLEKLPDALASGGKVAILSFHSGEDRRVKKMFKAMHRAGIYSEIAPDPIKASAEEINSNPRARSAKLRWAIKA